MSSYRKVENVSPGTLFIYDHGHDDEKHVMADTTFGDWNVSMKFAGPVTEKERWHPETKVKVIGWCENYPTYWF